MLPRRWRCRCSLAAVAVLALLVWVRRRFPTLRMDRFTEFAWVVLIPLTIAQALVVALVVLAQNGVVAGGGM